MTRVKHDIEREFQELLHKASLLPPGKWRAGTIRTNELVGPMESTKEYAIFTRRDPVKALKLAKRMAYRRDLLTRGEADGVSYFIENEDKKSEEKRGKLT